jgi:hypothetical protein
MSDSKVHMGPWHPGNDKWNHPHTEAMMNVHYTDVAGTFYGQIFLHVDKFNKRWDANLVLADKQSANRQGFLTKAGAKRWAERFAREDDPLYRRSLTSR